MFYGNPEVEYSIQAIYKHAFLIFPWSSASPVYHGRVATVHAQILQLEVSGVI